MDGNLLNPGKINAGVVAAVATLTLLAACSDATGTASQEVEHPVVVRGPDEGEVRWFQPASSDDLGEGAIFNIKVDRISVPFARMMIATQTLGASGIPVHLHTFEDELLYVVAGEGAAIVGEDRREIPVETGSVLYVPTSAWHGLTNADPAQRMEVLVVTTPAHEGGLGDFFLEASVSPGHPPLNLPEAEFLALFSEYGMRLPEE